MMPREGVGTAVISSSLRCEPQTELTWTYDVFGNLIATATFAEPTDQLIIMSEARLEHWAPEWPVYAIDPTAQTFPFAHSLDDVIDLGALAQPDWLTPGGDGVGSWARDFVMGAQTDSLSLLKDLNAGVLGLVAYRVREEAGTQSPAETLALRSGSCRDIAALFIEAARHLGFGARAVSGYLFDPTCASEDTRSTHAWAEVYLPGAGWIPFDPTHGRVGAGRLVPVAVARLNRQIMPVTGGYLGASEDFLDMEVSVVVNLGHPHPSQEKRSSVAAESHAPSK